MKFLDIGEVCARTGLRPSALRYYEDIGLLRPVGRSGLRRQYAPETVLHLRLVAMGRSAGFSLMEIAAMFAPDGQPELPRDIIHAKADELDDRIRELTALRDTLRHVADCPAPSHLECPSFRRLMAVAERQRSRRTQRSDRVRPPKRTSRTAKA